MRKKDTVKRNKQPEEDTGKSNKQPEEDTVQRKTQSLKKVTIRRNT